MGRWAGRLAGRWVGGCACGQAGRQKCSLFDLFNSIMINVKYNVIYNSTFTIYVYNVLYMLLQHGITIG